EKNLSGFCALHVEKNRLKILELSLLKSIEDIVQEIQKYKDDRKKLKSGESCFLCGSKKHPYIKHKKSVPKDEISAKISKKESKLTTEEATLKELEKSLTTLQNKLDTNSAILEDVEQKMKVSKLKGDSKDIKTILERLKIYISTNELIKKVKKELSEGGGESVSAVEELLDLILKTAIQKRATDVHIEPLRYNITIRARIDGVLKELFSFDKDIYYPLVSKIKLLADMNISEKRKPQDGRFTRNYNNHIYDFRVSTIPSLHGETVVIRILDQQKILLRLTELGMSEYNLKRFETLIHSPYGIVFVTGPTGSGKTTTLYAALNEVKGVDKKIITIEDPVEYELPLIQQIPINEKIGITFASTLRSVLRQDPDVIMIGEVRDKDTLDASIQASLTGHLVLATLHTNDAASTITRMVQMGAETYLVADSLIGVVAQRLIRRICPYCKTTYNPSKEELELIKPFLKEKIVFYKGSGCKECDFTGYLGREMISEVLLINEKISHLIALGKDKQEIVKVAKEYGFVTLVEDGVQKLKKGITTLEEILRVVKVDVF
ncbi:MAG: ATPase, T2SS/T4P/T4SS family, partial [Nautiliaceae bacterium]